MLGFGGGEGLFGCGFTLLFFLGGGGGQGQGGGRAGAGHAQNIMLSVELKWLILYAKSLIYY